MTHRWEIQGQQHGACPRASSGEAVPVSRASVVHPSCPAQAGLRRGSPGRLQRLAPAASARPRPRPGSSFLSGLGSHSPFVPCQGCDSLAQLGQGPHSRSLLPGQEEWPCPIYNETESHGDAGAQPAPESIAPAPILRTCAWHGDAGLQGTVTSLQWLKIEEGVQL